MLGWPGGTDFMPITFGGVLIVFFALEQLYLLVTDAPEAQI